MFVVGGYMVFSSYFVANHYLIRASPATRASQTTRNFVASCRSSLCCTRGAAARRAGLAACRGQSSALHAAATSFAPTDAPLCLPPPDVLSNLISQLLLAYCPSAAYTLFRAMAHDEWSTPRIRNMGVLYIPDAVSLVLVSRMATSTKIHHSASSSSWWSTSLSRELEEQLDERSLSMRSSRRLPISSTYSWRRASSPSPTGHKLTLSVLALVVCTPPLMGPLELKPWRLSQISSS